MRKFFKYKLDLVISIMFAGLCVYSFITKDYKSSMAEFIIATSYLEIFTLKHENNQLKMKSEEN